MILSQEAQTQNPAVSETEDQPCESCSNVNVGSTERIVSMAAGGLLVLAGLRARSLFGLVTAAVGGSMVYRGYSGHCMAYQALGIDTAHGGDGAKPEEYFTRSIHVEQSVTIDRPASELYSYWRNFENLPQFMNHLKSVSVTSGKNSHWVVNAPAGQTVEWDAEIINDEPNSLIAWRSLANANVDNAGSVRFVQGPEGRGTQVRVVVDYIPPGGRFGSWIAYLFGEEPSIQIREDLRRFKQIMEAGEAATVEGQPTGSCAR